MRPAIRTGIGLGVETAAAGIMIFLQTMGAHPEAFHRSIRPIVGNALDDAESGPAIRAVGERIQITAVVQIKDFAEAFGTGADVREDCGWFRARLPAFANF